METKPGIVGTVVTIGSGFVGWLAKNEAELRALSFFISVVVGLCTFIWWIYRFVKWFRVRWNEWKS